MVGNVGEIFLAIAKDSSGKLPSGPHIPGSRKEVVQQAIQNLKKGVAICTETSMLGGLVEFNQNLSRAYALAGNHKNALLCYKQYSRFKDSIFTNESIQKIALIDGKGEKEIKEKELEMQQMQLLSGRNEKRYYIAALASLVLLSGGLFQRFRIARRTRTQLEEKNALIAKEKDNADMLRLRAERSERFKRQFLANMSHEIRTPMNAVNGMTDLLLEKDPRSDQRHYLQVISRSSDILLHIVNDILDISKIEAGKLELETIDFSLSDTLRQVRDTLSFRAEEKGLYLQVHIDSKIPDVVLGDPFRLSQILMNLGGNAVKFTEHGSVEIKVSAQTMDKDHVKLLFSVTDTGIGIPSEKLPTLFESFRQVSASDSRVFGGTGLGLSISHQLVELQDGVIWAESEVGKGSTFLFALTYPVGSSQRLQARAAQEKKADGMVLNGMHILLVDDNEFNRMVAAETLHSKANITIDEAADGEEAVKMVARNDYDAVLMDIQMPVMDGFEATKYIRTRLPAPRNATPIIALTASLLRHDVEACREAGMDACVAKPFKAWQLIRALAEVSGRGNEAELLHLRLDESFEAEGETQEGITNLNYLERFCEGDKEKMKKFITAYAESVPAFIRKISAALNSRDLPRVATQVHAFKPRWMLMGMKKTIEVGTKIEQQVREQEYTDIEVLIAELISDSENSVKELTDKAG
jgi:signal transduction histidine kinase/CheY-like chemotaxis protein/HPt (histidine-containing phosphotransfer) domain-containing protein